MRFCGNLSLKFKAEANFSDGNASQWEKLLIRFSFKGCSDDKVKLNFPLERAKFSYRTVFPVDVFSIFLMRKENAAQKIDELSRFLLQFHIDHDPLLWVGFR